MFKLFLGILLILIFLYTYDAKSSDYIYFEDAEIIVILKNGDKYKYSSKEYSLAKLKKNFNNIKKDIPKNKDNQGYSLNLYGGMGPTHLITNKKGKDYEDVRWDYNVVVGSGLGLELEESLWLEGIFLSNRTYLGGLRFEF
jgi:hypothetical protein